MSYCAKREYLRDYLPADDEKPDFLYRWDRHRRARLPSFSAEPAAQCPVEERRRGRGGAPSYYLFEGGQRSLVTSARIGEWLEVAPGIELVVLHAQNDTVTFGINCSSDAVVDW